jgi:hypothetical protein
MPTVLSTTQQLDIGTLAVEGNRLEALRRKATRPGEQGALLCQEGREHLTPEVYSLEGTELGRERSWVRSHPASHTL